MVKVIITTLKQDFDIPHDVLMRYAELCGFDIALYEWGKGENADKLVKYTWKEDSDPNYVDNAYAFHMVGKQRDMIDYIGQQRFDAKTLSRTDPNLIKAFKEFQRYAKKDSWKRKNWKIIEVPDDVKWVIKHPRDPNCMPNFIDGEYIEEIRRIWR